MSQSSSAKLLGITFDENQKWKTQIQGTRGLLSALNKRLFVIRRLKNHFGQKALLKVVYGLFTSKIRYGLQLYGKVRRIDFDSEAGEF